MSLAPFMFERPDAYPLRDIDGHYLEFGVSVLGDVSCFIFDNVGVRALPDDAPVTGYRAVMTTLSAGGGQSPETRKVFAAIATCKGAGMTDAGNARVEEFATMSEGRDVTVTRRSEDSYFYIRARSFEDTVTVELMPEIPYHKKVDNAASDAVLDKGFMLTFTPESVGDPALFRCLQALPVAMLADYNRVPVMDVIDYPEEITHLACVHDRGNWKGRPKGATPTPT